MALHISSRYNTVEILTKEIYNHRMGIIEIENLTKKYGNFTAVDNLSLKVEKGSIFAFLGPNGAGKSTTIKMISTLLKPTSGEIFLDGISIEKNPHNTRKIIGVVFQDYSLDDELTAWENLDYHGVLYKIPKDDRRERMKELLKIVELSDRKNDKVENFSGGMKRRLEIARGLLHRPKIFFLDEPTIGLDPQTRNNIWNYIIKLNKEEQVTVFFTTHYMDEAEKHATNLAIIDNGKIVEQGTAPDIIKNHSTKSLEEAFIKLTGSAIRTETVSPIDKARNGHFRGRRNK